MGSRYLHGSTRYWAAFRRVLCEFMAVQLRYWSLSETHRSSGYKKSPTQTRSRSDFTVALARHKAGGQSGERVGYPLVITQALPHAE